MAINIQPNLFLSSVVFSYTICQNVQRILRAVKADLFVAAERRRVEQRAVVEELRNELRSTHTGVAVGVGKHGSQSRHHQHLHDGIVTQSGRLTFQKERKTMTLNIHGK